jgi:hypothetical protein
MAVFQVNHHVKSEFGPELRGKGRLVRFPGMPRLPALETEFTGARRNWDRDPCCFAHLGAATSRLRPTDAVRVLPRPALKTK